MSQLIKIDEKDESYSCDADTFIFSTEFLDSFPLLLCLTVGLAATQEACMY